MIEWKGDLATDQRAHAFFDILIIPRPRRYNARGWHTYVVWISHIQGTHNALEFLNLSPYPPDLERTQLPFRWLGNASDCEAFH
jgi:hypothetical protein